MIRLITLSLVLVTSIMLTACGGGGGGASNTLGAISSSGTAAGAGAGTGTGTGRIALSWSAPSSRADGSYLPLSELEGYRIYYGTSSTDFTMLVDLNDYSITEYNVTTLNSGNYYFAITAYDSNGVESGFSNMINKDI